MPVVGVHDVSEDIRFRVYLLDGAAASLRVVSSLVAMFECYKADTDAISRH